MIMNKDLNSKLSEMERKMETDKKMREMTKNSDDPLDAFMKQVKSGIAMDFFNILMKRNRTCKLKKKSACPFKAAVMPTTRSW